MPYSGATAQAVSQAPAMRRSASRAGFEGHRPSVPPRPVPPTKPGSADRVLTRFVLKYTLRAAHLELGGVDLDLAVEDDVLPLDRADMTQQVGVEREVRRGGKP